MHEIFDKTHKLGYNLTMKICTKCHIEYPATLEYFYKGKSKSCGLHPTCKRCSIKKSSKWNKSHPEKRRINKKKCYAKNPLVDNKRSKKWREANRERHIQNTKDWIAENKEKFKQKQNEWKKNNKGKSRASWRTYARKRAKNKSWKLSNAISRAISKSIFQGKEGYHWENNVDFTSSELKKQFEKQFEQEMIWNNYGTVWEIDHIIPISVFNFTSYNHIDFKKCWSLKNLRPLRISENRSKGSKLDKPFQPSLAFG